MTNEEKQLLLKDLCARLPYGVILYLNGVQGTFRDIQVIHKYNNTDSVQEIDAYIQFFGDEYIDIIHFKPYLRPMSSMTKKEKKELLNIVCGKKGSKYFHLSEEGIDSNDAEVQEVRNFEFHWINFSYKNIEKATDWLNKKMFDWRGLIPKGLALEALKSMYNN